MALDPIKIPQNVYIEDRIVGPLTLKQVLTVAIGGGFSYFLWSMLNKAYGQLPLPIMVAVWIPAALSALFAFVRINDLSLLRIALLVIEQMEKPAKRVWAPRQGIVINVRTFTAPTDTKTKAPPKDATPIEQLTRELDASPAVSVMAEAPVKPPVADIVAEPEPEVAQPLPRRAVNPQRVSVDPIEGRPGIDGVGTGVVPRSSIFRDLSPA